MDRQPNGIFDSLAGAVAAGKRAEQDGTGRRAWIVPFDRHDGEAHYDLFVGGNCPLGEYYDADGIRH